MTKLQIIHVLEQAAKAQPCVKWCVEDDIYKLNTRPDAKYGVFGIMEKGSTSVSADMSRHTFTLFYIDRRTFEKGNDTFIFSTGIDAVTNVLRLAARAGVAAAGGWSFTSFTQRFADDCAGVFTDVTFAVPEGNACGAEYEFADYNNDFNIDFRII